MTGPVVNGILEILTNELHLRVPSADTDLLATGTLDSLGLVELLVQIELKHRVRVEMETLDVEDFRTAARIAAYVERIRAGSAA